MLFGGLDGADLKTPITVFEIFDLNTSTWSLLLTEAGRFYLPAGLTSALYGFRARKGAILFLEEATATPVMFEEGKWTHLPAMGVFKGETTTGATIEKKSSELSYV